MAVATRGTASNYLQRAPSPSGLADVVDLILDKGLVIDAYVRVAVIGIELVTIDARIVIASVDTYLRFAEAVNRLDLTQTELVLQQVGRRDLDRVADFHRDVIRVVCRPDYCEYRNSIADFEFSPLIGRRHSGAYLFGESCEDVAAFF